MKDNNARSYAMVIGSMLIFGTIGIFRRFIPLPSALLACARGLIGALCLALFVKARGRSLRGGTGKKTFWLVALMGALIGVNWMLLFEAYNYTTVATATLCYYMQPTIVILLSPLFFRERLTGRKLLCAAVSVLGMVFVSGILSEGSAAAADGRGIACGLGAAALYATVVILNKKVPMEDAYKKTIIELFFAAVILIPYLLVTGEYAGVALTGRAVLLVLLVGVVHTGIAYALYFGSINGLKTQSIAVLSYIDPVAALILSVLVLGERMTLFGALGAVLIIGAALVSELWPARNAKA